MNYIEFENVLNVSFAKHGYTGEVIWGSSAKYSDAIIFCLTKPLRKSDVFLAIGKHGQHKVFDIEHSFPKEIDDLIYRFLSQDTEEWFRGLIVWISELKRNNNEKLKKPLTILISFLLNMKKRLKN